MYNTIRGDYMPKTLPIVITNDHILVKDKDSDEFVSFNMPGVEEDSTIPFYHQFASRISECQHYFKEFVKGIYGKKTSKLVLAIIVPDDTSRLELIFIKEFFLHSGVGKAVASMNMGQALSRANARYVSVSKSNRNVVLQYIYNDEIKAKKCYPIYDYDPKVVMEDAKRLHIDIEYSGVPAYINNINMNMDDFLEYGEVVSTKAFLDKISVIDVEKI